MHNHQKCMRSPAGQPVYKRITQTEAALRGGTRMKMARFALYCLVIARTLGAGLALVGCADQSSSTPVIVSSPAAQCNGNPYYCITFANESGVRCAMYIDGQLVAGINPLLGTDSKIVYVRAGETHTVNVCNTGGMSVGPCTTPQQFVMDGNKQNVCYPMQ